MAQTKAQLLERIERLKEIAFDAIDHVGFANYDHRIVEAKKWVTDEKSDRDAQ